MGKKLKDKSMDQIKLRKKKFRKIFRERMALKLEMERNNRQQRDSNQASPKEEMELVPISVFEEIVIPDISNDYL